MLKIFQTRPITLIEHTGSHKMNEKTITLTEKQISILVSSMAESLQTFNESDKNIRDELFCTLFHMKQDFFLAEKMKTQNLLTIKEI